MTIFNEIERDAKAGTPGKWLISDKWEIGYTSKFEDQSYGMFLPIGDVFGENREHDARRIANVPRYERAIMAASALEHEVVIESDHHGFGMSNALTAALAAFREASQ